MGMYGKWWRERLELVNGVIYKDNKNMGTCTCVKGGKRNISLNAPDVSLDANQKQILRIGVFREKALSAPTLDLNGNCLYRNRKKSA